jgi:hypothetical protein
VRLSCDYRVSLFVASKVDLIALYNSTSHDVCQLPCSYTPRVFPAATGIMYKGYGVWARAPWNVWHCICTVPELHLPCCVICVMVWFASTSKLFTMLVLLLPGGRPQAAVAVEPKHVHRAGPYACKWAQHQDSGHPADLRQVSNHILALRTVVLRTVPLRTVPRDSVS